LLSPGADSSFDVSGRGLSGCEVSSFDMSGRGLSGCEVSDFDMSGRAAPSAELKRDRNDGRKALTDGGVRDRGGPAILALGQLLAGEAQKRAIREILALLADKEPHVRGACVEAVALALIPPLRN